MAAVRDATADGAAAVGAGLRGVAGAQAFRSRAQRMAAGACDIREIMARRAPATARGRSRRAAAPALGSPLGPGP